MGMDAAGADKPAGLEPGPDHGPASPVLRPADPPPVARRPPTPRGPRRKHAVRRADLTEPVDFTVRAGPPEDAASAGGAPPDATQPAGKGRRRRRSAGFALLKIVAALLVVSLGALTLPSGWFSAHAWNAVAWAAGSTPPAATAARTTTLLASDGTPFASFYRQNRDEVPLSRIAPVMREAMVAAEDERFYDHGPLDTKGIIRAVVANVRGGSRQGASTLTQQYVKNLAVAAAKDDEDKLAEATAPTVGRKIHEFREALEIERRYTKDEILERYLNIAYFGGGAYGVEAAAQRYFAKPAARLTLPQAAMIAGLAKAPTADGPTADPAAAKARRNLVLDRMAGAGFIERGEADRAAAAPLRLSLTVADYGCADSPYPFFCDYVVSELRNSTALGRTPEKRIDRLLDGGLTIRTTLDPKVQDAAQSAVDRHIGQSHPIGAALVIVEPGTGAVRAVALNRRWGSGTGATQLNYALDRDQGGSSGFQAGSTFKPFVLVAAASKDIRPSLKFKASAEVTVRGLKKCDPDPHEAPYSLPYTVGNYDDEGFGRIDMRTATARSVNTYFVQLEKRTGVCMPPQLAARMGLKRADGQPLERYPSFVLGAQEVSPLRMSEAYATLAAGGIHCTSFGVAGIRTPSRKAVAVPAHGCERALSKDVAGQVTKLLMGVIDGRDDRRTGRKMSLGRPAAGKTGTTNDARAVWFVGYTKDLAAAVWAGYPGRSRALRNVTIKGETYEVLYGGALPGPIWRDAMKGAHKDDPKHPLP